jgi:hypothetical protein
MVIEQVHSNIPHYLRPNDLQKKMNAMMRELIPELASEYTQTPMANGKWKAPSDILDSSEGGVPCFIAAEKEDGHRQDYIWIPKYKDLPAGYYHFRTQEAYIQVNELLRKKCKARWTILSKTKKEDQEYNQLLKKIKYLMFNRLISDAPNDEQAARMRLFYSKAGGDARAQMGRATYLPTLSTAILSGLVSN